MTRCGLLLGMVFSLVAQTVWAMDLAALSRATIKLEAVSSEDPVRGTGVLITACEGRVYVLTAAHVLLAMPKNEVRLGFRSTDGAGQDRYSPQTVLLSVSEPQIFQAPGQDLALMRVDLPPGAGAPILVSDLATEDELKTILSQPGRSLQMVGYPKGLSSSRSGYGILRSGSLASLAYEPGGRFLVDAKVQGGMSGALVLDPLSGKGVGVVIEQVKLEGEALDLAIALPITWVRDQLMKFQCGG